MALIEFKNLPDTSTPANAANLNNNFNFLDEKADNINTKLGQLIITDNVTISSISINSGATVYKTFTIPSKTGYTPIAIIPNSTSGGGSSYMVFAPTLEGYISIYNGWGSNISNASISLKIIYLKN